LSVTVLYYFLPPPCAIQPPERPARIDASNPDSAPSAISKAALRSILTLHSTPRRGKAQTEK